MTLCPSDEKLASLAAETLSAAERDALAIHIDECALCLEKLARLTEIPDSATWQRTISQHAHDESEDAIVRRLKQVRRLLVPMPPDSADTPTIDSAQGRFAASATIDFEIPAVPGYEIIGILGRGGARVVFKARQLALQRLVAIKMLQNWKRPGDNELARFRGEADVIARLQHPNIVQIYDIGEAAGRPYFVLEYVAGGNLAQQLDGTPQSVRVAARFIEVLARAVDAAHANGIVHRDLKPANILLSSAQEATLAANDNKHRSLERPTGDGSTLDATPKIADFGLAKIAYGERDAQLHRSLTVTGDLIGTPSYMAPEQAAPSGAPVGPAADVYALGAIFYELLTGRPPFKGETILDTVLQVVHNDPVPITDLQPNVPRDVETICLKCLRKDPLHRYSTAN